MPSDVSWKRLTAEGIAIVLSILLAFGIDASWDALGERKQASRDVAGLRADFGAARAELERIKDLNDLSLAASDSVLTLIEGDEVVDIPTDLLFRLTIAATYDPPTGSVDALIASGRVSMLGDPALEKALASWSAAVGDLDSKSRLQETFVYERLVPEMRRVMPFRVLADLRGAPSGQVAVVVPVRPTEELRSLILQLRFMVYRTQLAAQAVPRVDTLLTEITDLLDAW